MNFNNFAQGLTAIVTAVIGVAIISVLVSKKSQTTGVITASGNTLAKVISAAVSPASNAPNNGNNGLNTFTTPALSNII